MIHRFARLFLALAVFLSFTPDARAEDKTIRAYPALLKMANERPNEMVKVIVQRKAGEEFQDHSLAHFGAKITKELPFINGFAAEMPAAAVPALAKAPGIRWISLDAPLQSAQGLPPSGNACNLLMNGDFENGLTGWTDWEETLDKQITNNAFAGSGALKLGLSAGAVSQVLQSVAPGETYVVSGMFLRSLGVSWMSIGIDFFDEDWVEIGEAYAEISSSSPVYLQGIEASALQYGGTSGTSAYTPLSFQGIAPAGTQYASLWIWKDADATLAVDSLKVSTVSALESATCSGFQQLVGYNLLSNGSFENEWSNWYSSSPGIQLSQSAFNGNSAARIGASEGFIAQSMLSVSEGITYTAKGMFWRPQGSSWAGIGIDFFDAEWNELDEAYVIIPETTSYQPVTVSERAPPGTAYLSVWISKNSGSYLLIDQVSVVAGLAPNAFVHSVGASNLWNAAKPLDGRGVTVAVVDSGISSHPDLIDGASRIVGSFDFSQGNNSNDGFGHGNHVAGIIGGNGNASDGMYRGVAPRVNLLNVKVSNHQGMSLMSDLLEALEWLYNNRTTYNVKVVNLSLNSTVPESYHVSPLSAAVEILWFNGVTVVVSAGNNGQGATPTTIYPPANDPFVITVGASDDRGTFDIQDDKMENFSAFGNTEDGFRKPDLVAPGRNIISLLSSTQSTIYTAYPSHRVNNHYFRMSGTSMATPVVSGAIALLLQDEPNLTPDQIKYRLMNSASINWAGYDAARSGAGYLNIEAAVEGTSTASANTGVRMSQMLYSGSNPVTWDSVNWNSVNWNSVNWNSVNWNSVNWNSVNWNSVAWSSDVWDEVVVQSIPTPNVPTTERVVPQAWVEASRSHLYLPLVSN